MQKVSGYLHRKNDRYKSHLYNPACTFGASAGVLSLTTGEIRKPNRMKPGLR
jgi:hypothetical protein